MFCGAAMNLDPQAVRAFEYAAWQRAASNYDRSFAAATRGFIPALLDAAYVGGGTRALDVACGPGYAAAAAAARDAHAVGVDFSPAMIAIARAEHPSIDFVQADAESLPFLDSSFAAVVSNFGVHHTDSVAALRQAHRVLRSGGHVAFTAWAHPTENVAWQLVLDAISRHGDGAIAAAPPPGGTFNRPNDCLRALEAAGFGVARAQLVRLAWPLRNSGDLIEALRRGTARMAALLAAQSHTALTEIARHVAEHAEQYRVGDHILVPIAALLASGRKI
jgi:ubiquinone/menaquinone biosynthesis C-methylase UbiE